MSFEDVLGNENTDTDWKDEIIDRFSDFVDDILNKELLDVYKDNFDMAHQIKDLLDDNDEMRDLLKEARDEIQAYQDKYGKLSPDVTVTDVDDD
jgi:hypothetical protein